MRREERRQWTASRHHAVDARAPKRLVEQLPHLDAPDQPARIFAAPPWTLFTTARVEALPLRITVKQRPARAVGAHDVGLHGLPVAHLGHIARLIVAPFTP